MIIYNNNKKVKKFQWSPWKYNGWKKRIKSFPLGILFIGPKLGFLDFKSWVLFVFIKVKIWLSWKVRLHVWVDDQNHQITLILLEHYHLLEVWLVCLGSWKVWCLHELLDSVKGLGSLSGFARRFIRPERLCEFG